MQSGAGAINAEEILGDNKVAGVRHLIGGGVVMVVTTVTVGAEAMGVLDTKTKALNMRKLERQEE